MKLNGEFAKGLMERKGWNTRILAQRVGVSQPTISRLLSGKRGAGPKACAGIMKAFPGYSKEQLFFLK